MNRKIELVTWIKTWYNTWYVNLIDFVFGKLKVFEWPSSQKWELLLYGYKFDKYQGWACPLMSLEVKHDICSYLVLNWVNKRYWEDPCRENDILA